MLKSHRIMIAVVLHTSKTTTGYNVPLNELLVTPTYPGNQRKARTFNAGSSSSTTMPPECARTQIAMTAALAQKRQPVPKGARAALHGPTDPAASHTMPLSRAR